MDVLKEYLVSIGFVVNTAQHTAITRQIKDLEKLFNGSTASMSANMVTAAKYMSEAILVVSGAIYKMVSQAARAQIEYQKFGTRMWMNTKVAKDFKIALDAMNESMEDIAWNKELRGQFKELMNMSKELRTPADASLRFKNMREILFSFKQLRVEITYAVEWISYYLLKYFDKPLEKVRKTLDGLHDKIRLNMPTWTNNVAKFLATIINIGGHAVRFIKDVWDGLNRIWDSFTPGTKKVLLAIAAITAAINMGPIGQIITAISTLLLLIDDYYGWREGKNSALGDIWTELDTPIRSLTDALIDAGEATGMLIDLFLKLFGLYDSDKPAKMKKFWDLVGQAIDNVADQIRLIASAVKVIAGIFSLSWDAKGRAELKKLAEEFWADLKHSGKTILHGGNGDADSGWDGSVGSTGVGPKPLSSKVRKRLKPYMDVIRRASEMYGVPVSLIERMIQQESQGKQSARSKKGAIGLMQLMPGTAQKLGVNPYNAGQNIMGGVRYLAQLYQQFGSWELALAAYNAGPGNVKKHGGVPHFAETQGYLRNILGYSYPSYQSGYLPKVNRSVANGQTTVSFGNIVVQVAGTNATPEEIANAVEQKLSNLNGVQIIRKIRDLSGVIV
jgi:hypothetical protein